MNRKSPSSPKQIGNEGEKKKPVGTEGNLVSTDNVLLPNIPALWVRSQDGGIRVLNNNAPAAAPSAVEPGIRVKAKKKPNKIFILSYFVNFHLDFAYLFKTNRAT